MLQGLQVIQILWVGRGWSEDELSLDGSEKWQDQSKSQETPGLETSIVHAHLLTHPNAVEISWARSFWQTERAEFKSVYVPVKNAIWLFKGTKAIAYQRIRKALEFKSLVHQPFGKDISHITHHCISSSDNSMSSSISTSKRCTNSSTAPRFARSASSGTTPKVSWFVPHLPKLFTKNAFPYRIAIFSKVNEKYLYIN